MSWNYRLIDYGSHLAVHEVHYRADGSVEAYTVSPRALTGDSVEEIEEDLKVILGDLRRLPILKESELPG